MEKKNKEKNSEKKIEQLADEKTLKHVLDDITSDLEKELSSFNKVDKAIDAVDIKNNIDTPIKKEMTKKTKPLSQEKETVQIKEEVSKDDPEKEKAEIKEAIKLVKKDYAPYIHATDSSISKEKPKKKKKKRNKERNKGSKLTFFFALLMSVILFLGICGAGAAGYIAYKLTRNMPEFEPMALESADSSIIYDAEGNQVIELGLYLRENIEYDELPECLVDAFVAVEDSRYFEHNGFDIPRFTKAIIENLKSRSFGQGGSTITMQLIKNSYFQIDDGENSTMADRDGVSGVQRKLQEIVLSMIADKEMSKEELLVLFLNKVNFGDNIRGVQKAAEYYFGKDAKDLNINESAFLAGIINSPNSCNPYNELYKHNEGYIYLNPNIEYLENANKRKNEVLDLMELHGYISEAECAYNKTIRVENLLTGKHEKFQSTNLEFQSYIDAVVDEVIEVTGYSPYTKAMNIYTAMDPDRKSVV